MTNEEILQGNKMIAEFMGLWEAEEGYLYNTQFEKGFRMSDLQYHSSWDWLMPVVGKIEDLGHIIIIGTLSDPLLTVIYLEGFEQELEGSGSSKIEAVYKACLAFIEWYNSQTKTKP
jgi:hypothetical protein